MIVMLEVEKQKTIEANFEHTQNTHTSLNIVFFLYAEYRRRKEKYKKNYKQTKKYFL